MVNKHYNLLKGQLLKIVDGKHHGYPVGTIVKITCANFPFCHVVGMDKPFENIHRMVRSRDIVLHTPMEYKANKLIKSLTR